MYSHRFPTLVHVSGRCASQIAGPSCHCDRPWFGAAVAGMRSLASGGSSGAFCTDAKPDCVCGLMGDGVFAEGHHCFLEACDGEQSRLILILIIVPLKTSDGLRWTGSYRVFNVILGELGGLRRCCSWPPLAGLCSERKNKSRIYCIIIPKTWSNSLGLLTTPFAVDKQPDLACDPDSPCTTDSSIVSLLGWCRRYREYLFETHL